MASSGNDIPLSSSDQTATSSPISSWNENYGVTLQQVTRRNAAFPTLQSFSAAQTPAGEWVLFGGRTNGLHNFPEASDSDNGKTDSRPRIRTIGCGCTTHCVTAAGRDRSPNQA